VHVVSLGSFNNQTGTFSNQAGTFIHEFGHNLGQRHGGIDHSNYKPNYLSVMNYYYQLDGIGVSLLALGFSNTISGFDNFSYSHGLLPDLNEDALDENLGIGLGRSVDWNCNGTLEDNISTDIQAANPCTATGARTVLTDFDNWNDIAGNISALSEPTFLQPVSSPTCIGWEEYQPIAKRISTLRSEGLLPPDEPRVRAPFKVNARSFTIWNDGSADLDVTSMILDIATSWITWEPQAPFSVPPGGAQEVFVYVDFDAAPAGQTTRQIRIASNDSDESPYPGGVNLVVNGLSNCTLTTGAAPTAGGMTTGDASVGCGATMTVKAFPNAVYTFLNWTQGATIVSTSTEYTFTLNANRTLITNFRDDGGTSELIFSDGFESGDTTVWSTSVP